MATKIVIKNQTSTSFGGIFYIPDEYRRLFFNLIDVLWGKGTNWQVINTARFLVH